MSIFQAVILGIVQGLTEFLPVSSSAHLVVIPWILRWHYQGLSYDVALHWGTLFAVAGYFWRDWLAILGQGIRNPRSPDGRILIGIFLASFPAAIAGMLLENAAETIFREPPRMAMCLMAFGLLLGLAQWKGKGKAHLDSMGLKEMIFIGASQALAIVPGVSRSGITITAGLFLGLTREASARFSFLLSVPIIMGAGLVKLKSLEFSQMDASFFIGILASAITGALAIKIILNYARFKGFGVFVFYRICLGCLILFLWALDPQAIQQRLGSLPVLQQKGEEMSRQTDSALVAKLRLHVKKLAQDIGERNPYENAALTAAREYVAKTFKEMGYAVEIQEYPLRHLPGIPENALGYNIIAVASGSIKNSEGFYVIGAHYDSAPGTPGADDNASGVAVLLETASLLKSWSLGKEIRFVAFSTEEPPSFGTNNMGSHHYAQKLKSQNEKVLGMVSLEMLGYYREEPNSQVYPPFLSWFYPNHGNFISFVSNIGSRKWLKKCTAVWRKRCTFPMESAALPSFIQAVTLSDHWSFIQAGYPALMVTDTAFFRNPYYHQSDDTPDKLDYEKMAALTNSLAALLRELGSPSLF